MPTTLTLNATGTELLVTVPTRWADVTMAQFVAMSVPAPDSVPVEILCGLPAGTLETLSVQAVAMLGNLLAFATDPADVLALLPTNDLPDVGSLSYGSLLLVRQRMEAQPDAPDLVHMAYILAIYRMELLWGKYDAARVAACEAQLLASPVTQVYPDASAFLSSWRNWQKGTNPTQPMTLTPSPKKSTPASKSWGNGSGRFSRWMRRLAGTS